MRQAPVGAGRSGLSGAATLRRMGRPGEAAGVPVICVGNFIAGGAGKTPTALALAALLQQRGETPVLLTRGYGGRLSGPVRVDPAIHGPIDIGDEPLLLARRAPTIVARDRVAGAALARSVGASVIIMDDGLQNPSLQKQLSLAVVDGAAGAGNGYCVPAGPLRAPLAAQLRHVQAVLIIGAGEPGAAIAALAKAQGKAVITATLEPSESARALAGRRVIAAAGIGRPEKFSATLRDLGAVIVAERPFGDHHAFRPAEVEELVAAAIKDDCVVATTEKDMTKLASLWPQAARERLLAVPVALKIDTPAVLEGLLDSVLAGRSGASGAL